MVMQYSNIYPTGCNVTQFILSGNCSTCFGWLLLPLLLPAPIALDSSNGVTNTRCCSTVVCAPGDGWWYHPKRVEKLTDKINCVMLHLVGCILEYELYSLESVVVFSLRVTAPFSVN